MGFKNIIKRILKRPNVQTVIIYDIGSNKFNEKKFTIQCDCISKTYYCPAKLDIDITRFFIKEYNKMFRSVNFELTEEKNQTFTIKHKILNVSKLQYILPNKLLYKETEMLLNKYINTEDTLINNLWKYNNHINYIKVYTGLDKFNADNYFKYNKKYYLLDIGNFYFVPYDKNDNIIPKEMIFNCEYELQDYISPVDNKKYGYTF